VSKPKTKEHILLPEQIDKINKNIKSSEEDFVFNSLLNSGLRISEFVHLRKTWINFNRNLIKVPEAEKCSCKGCEYKRLQVLRKQKSFVKDVNDEIEESTYRGRTRRRKKRNKLSAHQEMVLKGYWVPKTKASIRTIPVVPEAQEVLYPFFKQYKKVQDVYPWRQYVNNILNKLSKRSKIKIFPHCLRGTFATMLATKGFDAFEITDVMGWSDINVAIFYIKLSGTVLKNAFEEKWSRKY